MKNDADIAKIVAVEEIKKLKARYFRAIDTQNWALLEKLFDEHATADYRGAATDPLTGESLVPAATEAVLDGKASIVASLISGLSGTVSIHMGYMPEIEITSLTSATGTWAMSDTLHFPAGSPIAGLSGSGHYFETYECKNDVWLIKALRLTRLRVNITSAT